MVMDLTNKKNISETPEQKLFSFKSGKKVMKSYDLDTKKLKFEFQKKLVQHLNPEDSIFDKVIKFVYVNETYNDIDETTMLKLNPSWLKGENKKQIIINTDKVYMIPLVMDSTWKCRAIEISSNQVACSTPDFSFGYSWSGNNCKNCPFKSDPNDDKRKFRREFTDFLYFLIYVDGVWLIAGRSMKTGKMSTIKTINKDLFNAFYYALDNIDVNATIHDIIWEVPLKIVENSQGKKSSTFNVDGIKPVALIEEDEIKARILEIKQTIKEVIDGFYTAAHKRIKEIVDKLNEVPFDIPPEDDGIDEGEVDRVKNTENVNTTDTNSPDEINEIDELL